MPYTPEGAPFVGAPDNTSGRAARSLDGSKLDRLETEVFNFLKKRGTKGATDDEIERHLNMRHQTASARRRTLVLKGRVSDSERERRTRSGRWATVWVVAELGKQLALPGV